MDFAMQIDSSRKRCRDEPELHGANDQHLAKRARQWDMDASTRDSTPSLGESTPSTPASIDVDMDDTPQQAPIQAPTQAPKPAPEPFQSGGGMIISGWNQNRRDQYLRQGYPLAWMQSSMQAMAMLTLDQ
ncbi:hypothetical protein F5144DRAFT_546192 [Chaetomium tenue]|uniref:Uncharacterized protein n=1 Tax=Chaetomium tenue TaxID=1854479 RepID=A0ACB7PDG5_9PEZI|nr:hypothetical protein F5144DRAFT_546192 [Chaetomium globosum]